MFTYARILMVFVLIGLAACQSKETITIKTPSGQQAVFSVSIAQTLEQQQKGLMFVDDMPEGQGMLFAYSQPSITKFWMRDTLIPLDMLFFDVNGVLRHVEHSAIPHDESPRGPDTPICFVLEINGGLAEKMNITVGSKLITDIPQECLQSPNN